MTEVEQRINNYLTQKVSVIIIHNDDAGLWLWAICVDIKPDFWLNAFTTKTAAIAYCKKHKLKITKVLNTKKTNGTA